MGNRGKLKNYEKAYIIELYFYHKKTTTEISKITGFSRVTVSRTVGLYFKKPKTNKTLKSKV